MAERRPPGFNVDLGFYDSDEVLSIPRKIRAAAIGVWTLCGAYSANKLTDGYVSAEALKDRGCTPAIRSALMSTTPIPLWESEDVGAIRFTRWAKWQRTSGEVKAYREADAERKRKAREARKAAETSDDPEMSERTPDGHPPDVRSDSGTPKTETETKTEFFSSYVPDEPYESDAPEPEFVDAAVPKFIENGAKPSRQYPSSAAKTVVRQELGSVGYTREQIDRLAVQVDKLARQDCPDADIRESLVEWDRRENCDKPEYLITVYNDVVKRSRAIPGNNGKPTHKLRTLAELEQETRAQENAQLETFRATRELT